MQAYLKQNYITELRFLIVKSSSWYTCMIVIYQDIVHVYLDA